MRVKSGVCAAVHTFEEPRLLCFLLTPVLTSSNHPNLQKRTPMYVFNMLVPMKTSEKLDLIGAKVIISLNDNKVTLITI